MVTVDRNQVPKISAHFCHPKTVLVVDSEQAAGCQPSLARVLHGTMGTRNPVTGSPSIPACARTHPRQRSLGSPDLHYNCTEARRNYFLRRRALGLQ